MSLRDIVLIEDADCIIDVQSGGCREAKMIQAGTILIEPVTIAVTFPIRLQRGRAACLRRR